MPNTVLHDSFVQRLIPRTYVDTTQHLITSYLVIEDK